jgi:hypothetical protein
MNEVLFSKMDTREVRWEENDINPRKKLLKTNHLPKPSRMETIFNFCFIFFSECFQTGDIIFPRKISLKICTKEKRKDDLGRQLVSPPFPVQMIVVSSWKGR